MITLDTSAILAALNRLDPDHKRVRSALLGDPGPYLVPAGILAEATYLIERRLGLEVLTAFLADLERNEFTLECGRDDFARIGKLVRRYANLRLGAADASVIACGEGNGGAILTLDVRDFGIVAKEAKIRIFPR